MLKCVRVCVYVCLFVSNANLAFRGSLFISSPSLFPSLLLAVYAASLPSFSPGLYGYLNISPAPASKNEPQAISLFHCCFPAPKCSCNDGLCHAYKSEFQRKKNCLQTANIARAEQTLKTYLFHFHPIVTLYQQTYTLPTPLYTHSTPENAIIVRNIGKSMNITEL